MKNALNSDHYGDLIEGANKELKIVFPKDEDFELVEIKLKSLTQVLDENVDAFIKDVKTWNQNLESKGNIFMLYMSQYITKNVNFILYTLLYILQIPYSCNYILFLNPIQPSWPKQPIFGSDGEW